MPVNRLRGSGRLIMCVTMPLRFLSNTMETPRYVRDLIRCRKNESLSMGVALNSAVSSPQYKKRSLEGARMQGKGRGRGQRQQNKPRVSHNDRATLQLSHCVTAGICWIEMNFYRMDFLFSLLSVLFLQLSRYPSIRSLCSGI